MCWNPSAHRNTEDISSVAGTDYNTNTFQLHTSSPTSRLGEIPLYGRLTLPALIPLVAHHEESVSLQYSSYTNDLFSQHQLSGREIMYQDSTHVLCCAVHEAQSNVLAFLSMPEVINQSYPHVVAYPSTVWSHSQILTGLHTCPCCT